ncbi:MAG: AI-2E family transporter [Ignavibacteriales bacterium]|nr:AI-2E family transporter [Ignavibacteriales bacterium]
MIKQIMPLTDQLLKKSKTYFLVFLSLCTLFFLSYLFADILAMLAVSILISLLFNPIVGFLEKRGFSRLSAVLTVFAIVILLIIASFSFLIPRVINQFNSLSVTLTQENLQLFFQQIENSLKSTFPFLNSINIVEKFTNFSQNVFSSWISNFSDLIYSIVSLIAILVIVPFMTFFLLKDNKHLLRGIINIMPNKYFEVSYSVFDKIALQLGRFVRGWILDAFLVGLLCGVGLKILGINNAISIGFIAGVGHLIPYFGPIVGGIPAIIISIIQYGNLSMLPSIIIMFLTVYVIDNGFIQPNIFAKATDIHPLLIIILIIAGSQLLGVLGMLLAVPAATVVKTASREIYNGYKRYKIIRS